MRRPVLAAILLGSLAQAEPARPDVMVAWTEPTCDAEALAQSATRRVAAACGDDAPTSITWQYRDAVGAIGCEVWAHAWCPSQTRPTYAPAGAPVRPTLYADKDFKGQALVLGPGLVSLDAVPMRDGGSWEKKAGSARVPAGWTLRLCDAAEPVGRCTDVVDAVADLGQAWVGNDAARLATVTQGAMTPYLACPRAFENDNFGGKFLDLCQDMPDLKGSAFNDMFSSILVPPGWHIRVCDGVTGVPPCADLVTDTARLNDTSAKADKISSVQIMKRP